MPDRPTVIVADDDPAIRDLIAQCVDGLGFATQKAATGFQVLKLLQECVPALVISDLFMPGGNGLKVCTVMRATPSWADVPVLIVSGHADRRMLVEAIELGANDFVAKPFTLDVLRDKIQRLVKPPLESQETGLEQMSEVASGT